MRVYHRYLGFFLTGIMAMYALSGIVLILRDTDLLKVDKQMVRKVPAESKIEELGRTLRIKDFKVEKEEGDIIFFKQGTYNKGTGIAQFTSRELPFVLDKMTHLHKASTKEPLFFFNIFFGISLLFFVVSSFWMFMPSSAIFKKGLYFIVAGLILTLILLFV
jgi:hypothetical protein